MNEVRKAVEKEIESKQVLLEEEALNQQLENETIDVTLPGRKVSLGAKHPLTKINEDLEDLFIGLGYEIVEGYEVESDYYNFEALNLPKSHPARDMQDTFYISEEILMRTHTSPVQARTLENVMVLDQLKLSVQVKFTVETLMMRHTVINSHKLKV